MSGKVNVLIILVISLTLVLSKQVANEWETCGTEISCREGLECFKQSQWYSQCLKQCPPDWDCNKIDTTQTASTTTDTSSTTTTTTTNNQNEDDAQPRLKFNNFTDIDYENENATFVYLNTTSTIATAESTITLTVANSTTSTSTTTSASTNSSHLYEANDPKGITFDQFVQSIVLNKFPAPDKEKYDIFISRLEKDGGINSKREAAMFLSQVIWESGGLVHKKELACIETGCPWAYKTNIGPQDKNYYGRGYIQLSWDYNYKAASYDLFDDDRLLKNPDQVAESEELSWSTALWYWKNRVSLIARRKIKIRGQFGTATNLINGGLECKGPHKDKARKRFEMYKIVLKALEINEEPNEKGCYN